MYNPTMTKLRVACVLTFVTHAALAHAKPPSVVDAFNKIDPAHSIKKTGDGWTVKGKLAATVDLANGYLSFADPATHETTTAAIWKATNNRWFVGITSGRPGMSWWEVDGADDNPEESEPRTPSIAIDELVMPDADAKLVAANATVFHDIIPRFELPRRGTTLVARIELSALREDLDGAKLADDVKKKLRALVDTQLYTRVELTYRQDGHFDIAKKSK
jgi:hypothetical protein